MSNAYSDTLEKLLSQANPELFTTHPITFKNCFGAIAGYVDDRIFVSCGKFGVALRLPPEVLTALLKEMGVSRLRYFPKGHVKKEYAVLPRRMIDNQDRFRELLDKSVTFVLSMSPSFFS